MNQRDLALHYAGAVLLSITFCISVIGLVVLIGALPPPAHWQQRAYQAFQCYMYAGLTYTAAVRSFSVRANVQ